MKIKGVKKIITPQLPVYLAGYGNNILAETIHDDLYVTGLVFDDGKDMSILLNYDLLGLDEDTIKKIKVACSEKSGVKQENIILTCTHTHSGPQTRRMANTPFDEKYIEFLISKSVALLDDPVDGFTEVDVFHYSTTCDESVNRRVMLPDNTCKMLPENKHLATIADGVVDNEIGILFFVKKDTDIPVAVLVNYAAHPLACQSGGSSSLSVTADYPGVIRQHIMEELGADCIFCSGACGDIHPKNFESGFNRVEEMGISIARKVISVFTDAVRNRSKYMLGECKIKNSNAEVEVFFRATPCKEERLPFYRDIDKVSLNVQFLAIGDICFVGVPGELLVEPGLEIKWHSPFRRTYILYNSTAYISYICHANAFVAGGYEADTSHLEPKAAFKIVSATINELFRIKYED
jgi:hypothetical protein